MVQDSSSSPVGAIGPLEDVRTGTDPAIVSNPKIKAFHAYWRSRCRDGRLPAREDMDPLDMAPYLANTILLRVHRNPLDFEYRIIGENIIAQLGNLKGQRVKAAALINLSSSAYVNYATVAESGQPQFLEGTATTAFRKDRTYVMSRVHCPLAADGRQVDHIITCVFFL